MVHLDRRFLLAGGAACALAGCVGYDGSNAADHRAQSRLDRLVQADGVRRLSAAGFIVSKRGEWIASGSSGSATGLDPIEDGPAMPFTLESPMRVASISKMVAALTARRVCDSYNIALDDDVSPLLPAPLRHPAFPDTPITLRHLLAHISTIQDPAAYWVAAPHSIGTLIKDTLYRRQSLDGERLSQGPGAWFEYANINYGLAATALETATGRRFDQLAHDLVTQPLGLDVGFNWSGVSRDKRRFGATLYRKIDGMWRIQTDGPDALQSNEPTILAEPNFDLSSYTPGDNGTLFSPQGGLRASLGDLVRLAAVIGREPRITDTIWRLNADASNGWHEGGIFTSFGTGVMRFDADNSPWPQQTMIGHQGLAYGLFAGAWHLPGLGVDLAYAVTGTPDGEQPPGNRHPALNMWEQTLIDIARAAAGLDALG